MVAPHDDPQGRMGISRKDTAMASTRRGRRTATTVALAGTALLAVGLVGGPSAQAATTTSTLRIGTSVQGRALIAIHRSAPGATKRVLVIGVIHGNEKAGWWVIERLKRWDVPANVDLWLIPTINPDGMAANTRTNAHKVDLNRNFPHSWVYGGKGTSKYSGPSAGSEPETRAVMAFVKAHPPRTTVVLHQPLYGVDSYQAKSITLVRALARETQLPVKSFSCWSTCHGTFTGWHNAYTPGRAVTIEFGASVSTWRLNIVAYGVRKVGSAY
jgi:protein MpaA